MWKVITACVIIHTMIVEEEHDDIKYDQWWDFEGELVAPRMDHQQIFFKCSMNCETIELTTDFKKIWLPICAIMLDAIVLFVFYLFEFKLLK
jgi:hypothetical protein